MKIILTAINAKYIHSNLAILCLKAYARQSEAVIETAEYTINQRPEQIIQELYRKGPDIFCFSCYIWNIRFIEEIVRTLKKIMPSVQIWLGGPEVSYNSQDVLMRMPEVDLVIKGEGEATFCELLEVYSESKEGLRQIPGISYRDEAGAIYHNDWREVIDLSSVPFVYQDMDEFKHKIVYYETSRGCPFSCSYCLSSVDKTLRFRDLEMVKSELQFFLDQRVSQVKFVDRTFNCNHAHAFSIWNYLHEYDNGVTNFHFEISADLLTEKEIELIGRMRPGLIQLEIGVQSTNPETIREINRTMKFEQVKQSVLKLSVPGNVHQHLDLIVGLPYEDYQSFSRSFNETYGLRPDQLQMGFLKVLKGSCMEAGEQRYQLVYQDTPPFEVLCTKWLPYEDLLRLKGVEEMLEVYYNSGQFAHTLRFLEQVFPTPFAMYEELSRYYEERDLMLRSHTRLARYEILFSFAVMRDPTHQQEYRELLIYDFYLRDNMKNRPAFAGSPNLNEEWVRKFYRREEIAPHYLGGEGSCQKRQLRKMTHMERFTFDVLGDMALKEQYLLFDYRKRDLHNNAAFVQVVLSGSSDSSY